MTKNEMKHLLDKLHFITGSCVISLLVSTTKSKYQVYTPKD